MNFYQDVQSIPFGSVRDLHASMLHQPGLDHNKLTMLHQLGLDHSKLTFPLQGLDQKLTGVEPAKVVKGIIS